MSLKQLFEKPVDRTIEGVIKADDESGLRQELEEYVITNEVAKRLESFLDAYCNYAGANGVWVSGFFGSGKSHLLKMLALLLENRQVDGASALDIFQDKTRDNEILRGDLKRAAAIPSQSILFNIDQKADVISKKEMDALLAVFVKVFDGHCGYFGKLPFIAQMERDLDNDDLFDTFKEEIHTSSGQDWSWVRMREKRMAGVIDAAFSKVTGQPCENIVDKYRSDYRLSIEDFAEQVNSYIQRQGPDFRLNFFVDEVGQYIADNVKLMTNLQTVAESLNTRCEGRSWIIVTAQEDMSTVLGEFNQQQSNDFSKIQARFNNRMKLTSQDVAEVIQKRLLLKNEKGVASLSDLYHFQENNFKTLFDFVDGSQSFKNYRDRDHFIHSFPFIPYQFQLFQSVIQSLSQHNAFEGKHSSVGERSMLGVFQQVVVKVADNNVAQLATFDLMFEGIRSSLKAQIQQSVIHAENQLDDQFAIRLVKALFLVKYVKGFKATLRNLVILMTERFDQDRSDLTDRVEEALNLLEQQTYIQRSGEVYEYLTDEEKDVEQEIKNTEVEVSDVLAELESVVYDHTIKSRKIRYEANGQDYPYSRLLDDKLHGRDHELTINIISPFHDEVENPDRLKMQNMAREELLVIMPADDRLMNDLLMFKKTEKYIKQNISRTGQESIKRILQDKGHQNQERMADIKDRAKLLLGRAKLHIAGGDLDIGSEDAQTRVIKGFQKLIERTYKHLGMLRGINFTEQDVVKYLSVTGQDLVGNDATSLSEQEQEVLSFIQSNKNGGIRTTLKSLLERFEKKPYGWPYAAILSTVAMVCARGKVELRSDSNLLDGDDLREALLNTRNHGNTVLEPQVEFSASQVRRLKDFYSDFFDQPPKANEAKALGKETAESMKDMQLRLQSLMLQSGQFPFLNTLKDGLEVLGEHVGKPYIWYLTELPKADDDLFDFKENFAGPIQKFMGGVQKDIYSEASQFLNSNQPNLGYVEGAEVTEIKDLLNDPLCFRGNKLQTLKSAYEALSKQLAESVDHEKQKALSKISDIKEKITGMDELSKCTPEQQTQVSNAFDRVSREIEQQALIAVIKDKRQSFEDREYPNLLNLIMQWAIPPSYKPEPDAPAGPEAQRKVADQAPTISVISMKDLSVDYSSPLITSEADVDQYLKALRTELLSAIKQKKRIRA